MTNKQSEELNINTKKSGILNQHIPMQGTPNFRDLGGILNQDGRQVRCGVIFRSGSLANLTSADLELFKNMNIKKVIDFRTPDEIKREPDRYPDNNVQCIHAMIGNPANVNAKIGNGNFSSITPQQADEYMLTAYSHFVDSLNDFQPIFNCMVNDGVEYPFLFHCAAGKDRTGIAAALILKALNVSRDEIINDYMLSNTYNIPFFEANKTKMAIYGFTNEVIKTVSSVKPVYLQTLFDAVEKKYSNVSTMFEQVFGLTHEKRNLLVEKYTF